MGFQFNPELTFICLKCSVKPLFTDTNEWKEHQLQYHLGDCLNISKIIFEARMVTSCGFIDNDKIDEDNVTVPESRILENNATALNRLRKMTPTPNPSVSLQRLQIYEHIEANENSLSVTSESEQEDELKDHPFIVASIIKNADGSETIEFVETVIPTTDQELETLKQEQKYLTISDDEIGIESQSFHENFTMNTNSNNADVNMNTCVKVESSSVIFEVENSDELARAKSFVDTNHKYNHNSNRRKRTLKGLCVATLPQSIIKQETIDSLTADVNNDLSLPHCNCSNNPSTTPSLRNIEQNVVESRARNTRQRKMGATKLPPSEFSYNIRRNRTRINYSESQLCKYCEQDFYTIEDVEDHEPVCEYRMT